jgi:hypothetical protein
MSDDAALFDTIKHKIKPKAVSQCPDAPGDLAVYVVRADDGTPIANARVKASGPSPGEAPTGPDGWVVFADVKPGSYNAEIRLPEALSKYQLDQAMLSGSVACADTKILQFKASPPPPVKPLIEAPAVGGGQEAAYDAGSQAGAPAYRRGVRRHGAAHAQ